MHPTMLNDDDFKLELCKEKARTQLGFLTTELSAPSGIPRFTKELRYGLVDQLGTLGKILKDRPQSNRCAESLCKYAVA